MIRQTFWSRHAAAALLGAAGDLDTLEEIAQEARQGLAQVWRVDTDEAQGWVVTRVEMRPDGPLELVVVLGAGHGARSIIPWFKHLAVSHDLPRIRTHIKRRGLRRLYEREGFRVDHEIDGHLVMVWADGQQE